MTTAVMKATSSRLELPRSVGDTGNAVLPV
jgi:hypothetical protein